MNALVYIWFDNVQTVISFLPCVYYRVLGILDIPRYSLKLLTISVEYNKLGTNNLNV